MPSITTGLGRISMQVFFGLGGFQEILTRKTCLQRQQYLRIQVIIWLIQSSLTQHHHLLILVRCRLIFTRMHLSTYHTTRVVAESGFWDCVYIFYSNQSSMVINLRGLYKYESNQRVMDKRTVKQKRRYVREIYMNS